MWIEVHIFVSSGMDRGAYFCEQWYGLLEWWNGIAEMEYWNGQVTWF